MRFTDDHQKWIRRGVRATYGDPVVTARPYHYHQIVDGKRVGWVSTLDWSDMLARLKANYPGRVVTVERFSDSEQASADAWRNSRGHQGSR